jgi:hypothetical protein
MGTFEDLLQPIHFIEIFKIPIHHRRHTHDTPAAAHARGARRYTALDSVR